MGTWLSDFHFTPALVDLWVVGFLKVGRSYIAPLLWNSSTLAFLILVFLIILSLSLSFSPCWIFYSYRTVQATLHYHQSLSKSHCASQVHPHLTPFPPGEVSVWGSQENIEMGIQRLPFKSYFFFFLMFLRFFYLSLIFSNLIVKGPLIVFVFISF